MTNPSPTIEERVAALEAASADHSTRLDTLAGRVTTLAATVAKIMDRYKRWQQSIGTGGQRTPVAERLEELADRVTKIENPGA